MKHLGLSAAAVLALAAMMGCHPQPDDGDSDHQQEAQLGSVKLSLSGVGTSGDAYTLRNAILVVQGPSSTTFYNTEDDPSRTVITANVPVGEYSVFMQEGWFLERTDHHTGQAQRVDALLTSTNPQLFAVASGATTLVSLAFDAGGDVVGMGSFQIGIDVSDDPHDGGVEPPEGYCKSDGDCQAGATCCMAGFLGTCVELAPGESCALPDLVVDEVAASASILINHETFAPNSCALEERCVDAAGDRRLLRFDTRTPNIGQADMILGPPSEDLGFEYSACHAHYHFNGYANYELRDTVGNIVRTGHKQAFCLLDLSQDDPNAGPPTYHCGFQGISAGWADIYGRGLDCQWVDITGVAAGDYELTISLNIDRTLPEANYDNNTAHIAVSIPEDVPPDPGNPVAPCSGGEFNGLTRECGWSVAQQSVSCTPGQAVNTHCGGCGGGGSCAGDPMIRVCEGTAACTGATAIAQNDDDGACGVGARCPLVDFTCPESGVVTIMTAPFTTNDTSASCQPIVQPVVE
jgi:hypothetical protein